MTRSKLTALGGTACAPPVHRCACGCGGEASLGYPFGRWFVPGHQPAEAAGPEAARQAEPGDLFQAAGVKAPTRFAASHGRRTT